MERTCESCGSTFKTSPNKVKKGYGRFCSISCHRKDGARRVPGNAEPRFWARVRKAGPSPKHAPELGACWEWDGHVNMFGYGSFSVGSRTMPAHRFGYELQIGPIPPGLRVLHQCDNPRCVRGSHLKVGTDADNARDRAARHRHGGNPKLTSRQVVSLRHAATIPGMSKRELAATFGLSVQGMVAIITGKQRAADPGPIQTEIRKEYSHGEQHPRCLLTEQQVFEIRECHKAGETQREISKRYGVSPATISAIVRRINWKWLDDRSEVT